MNAFVVVHVFSQVRVQATNRHISHHAAASTSMRTCDIHLPSPPLQHADPDLVDSLLVVDQANRVAVVVIIFVVLGA